MPKKQAIMRFPRIPPKNGVTEKVLTDVLAGMNKHRKKNKQEASVVTLGNSIFATPKIYIPSGIVALDCIVGYGKGWPPGIIEIYGPNSSGKTAIMECSLAQTQRLGGYTALYPPEMSPDFIRMKSVGIDENKLAIFEKAECIEDFYDELREFVIGIRKRDTSVPIVVGWDSIAATKTRRELEDKKKKGLEGSDMGSFAAQMSKFFRRQVSFLMRNNVCLLCINQTRASLSGYGNPETTPGGKAMLFYAWVRCRISAGKPILDKDGEEIGINSLAKIRKNKFAPPFRSCTLPIYWSRGIDFVGAAWQYCIDRGIITLNGSVYSFEGFPLSRKKFPAVYLERKEEIDKLMRDSVKRQI